MRNIRWQKMALRAANGLLDGVTALLVLLAVVWSGYALWDNSRVYAAADNVQAGLLAFKPQPQEDNSLSFGQLRDINPDVCGWLTLDGTAIDYPVVQGCLLFIALLYVAVNLVVDLLYPLFDPRVKLQ